MMTNLVLKGMCTRKNIGLCENREKQYQHIVAGEVPKILYYERSADNNSSKNHKRNHSCQLVKV